MSNIKILNIIWKKRLGKTLSKEEIEYLIKHYSAGEIKDYQMSALAMAIVIKGMTIKETSYLTKAMMDSGETISLKEIKGIKVDKHSTGGIGDKTTLVIAPVLAALGLKVAKMSGRGLGFTGGTIDKLESIPGYNPFLSKQAFIKQVNKIGLAVVGQSANLVPADKKLYALRDVTSTVESLPLIVSSIMSKKLAIKTDAILLDVKVGSGAFMKNYRDGLRLAKWMIKIGKKLKRNVRAEITNMDYPLGRAIGNKNEVIEAIETLNNKGPEDFRQLIISSATSILLQTKMEKNKNAAMAKAKEALENGTAFAKFKEWIVAQGGDLNKILEPSWWNPKYKKELKAQKDGRFCVTSAVNFGLAAVELGAGRKTKEDAVDFEAGIYLNKKTNEPVKKGDLIITLYSSKPISESVIKQIKKSYKINSRPVKKQVILGKVK